MDPLTTLCIFITILFLYIHIANQFKTSEELEIYETDYNSLKHLEDVCELKQPFLMKATCHGGILGCRIHSWTVFFHGQ